MSHPRDGFALRAMLNLCVCESFDMFGIPSEALRQPEVQYKTFHRGKLHNCPHPRCNCLPSIPTVDNLDGMATWLPRNRATVGVFVDGMKRTYIMLQGRLMHASEQAMMGHLLPPMTGVLAHYVEDHVNGAMLPRLLVFDIYLHESRRVYQQSPQERYAILLPMLQDCKGFVSLQWVGRESSAVKNLPKLRQSLPHEAECILRLGHDPWRPERVMQVDTNLKPKLNKPVN